MTNCTVCELIEKAADRRGFRSRQLRRRLRRPRFREEFEDEMTAVLVADTRVVQLIPVFGTAEFDKDTEFGFDPSNLERLLDIILEYAPRIWEMIQLFFSL